MSADAIIYLFGLVAAVLATFAWLAGASKGKW